MMIFQLVGNQLKHIRPGFMQNVHMPFLGLMGYIRTLDDRTRMLNHQVKITATYYCCVLMQLKSALQALFLDQHVPAIEMQYGKS